MPSDTRDSRETLRSNIRTVTRSLSEYRIAGGVSNLKRDEFSFDSGLETMLPIPEEITLQQIIDKSDGALRMYGTAVELRDNLRIFRNFVGSNRLFDNEEIDQVPEVVQSMKKNEFISKEEIILFLTRFTGTYYKQDHDEPIVVIVAWLYMKYIEKRLNGCYELVEVSCLKNLEMTLTRLLKRTKEIDLPAEKRVTSFTSNSESGLLEQWKRLLAPEWLESGFDEFYPVFNHYCDINPTKKNLELHKRLLTNAAILIQCLQHLVDQNPKVFRPFLSTKNNDFPIAIRIFEDNSHRFLMFPEVRKAMIMVANSGDEHVVEDDCANMCTSIYFHSISMKDVVNCFQHAGLSMDRIELIPTKIRRAKHSAVPIITPFGNHCKLISDVFFEFMRTLIFDQKLFQRADGNWEFIKHVFQFFEHWFRPLKGLYFLQYDEIPFIFDHLKTFSMDKLAKDVRNAKVDGFTVQNLKNELKNLGLLATFPNILDHAQLAYDTVSLAKKETYLRTCDLFDAVEQCQLLCFFEKMPQYVVFVHLQHSCYRVVGLNCTWCEKEKKTKREEVQLPPDQIMPPLVKVVRKQEIPTKKPVETVAKQLSADAAPKQKNESNCCKKCLRTSEVCKKAKEDLKQAQNRIKSLEKKLATTERNLDKMKEKNERSREEAEKMLNEAQSKINALQKDNDAVHENIEKWIGQSQNSVDEVIKKNEELLAANTSVLRLEAENKEKEATIRMLLKTITDIKATRHVAQVFPPPFFPPTPTTTVVPFALPIPSPNVSDEVKAMLSELLEIEHFLKAEDHVGKARQIAEQLICMTDSETIFNGASFEVEQYQKKFDNFAFVVNQSIEKINSNPLIRRQEIPPLPDFPSFSDRFMQEYEKALKESTLPEAETKKDELDDNECLICLFEMNDNHETIKCHHCKRRYHSSCAAEWLKRKSICPACYTGLLDPAEFPHL